MFLIAVYGAVNHLFKLRWLLAAEVKSKLKLENLPARFHHPDARAFMKIYQESAQIRDALLDLNSISGAELPTFLQRGG